MKDPNPYFGTAFEPLDDDWAQLGLPVWNTRPGAPPPVPAAVVPPGTPRPLRSSAVKLTSKTLQIGSDPQAVLPENENRQIITIQNNAGASIYMGLSEIPAANRGFEIVVGGSYDRADPAPSNQIYLVCPTGVATVTIAEG